MKNQIILLLFFTGSIGFSQGVKTNLKTAITQDVAVDALKYTDSSKEEEITVDGKDVVISGNENKITFKGAVGKIVITGKNNDIFIESVKQIIVPGSGNFVSWEKSDNAGGKPVIQDKGGYNNIERRSDNAMDRSDN
jgi:hypothetical protein